MGKLTAVAVRTLKVAGRYSDGNGLILVVQESGAKSWLLRIQWNGKRHDIGLGSLDTVSLSDARERALETRKQIRAGGDPIEAKRASRRFLAALPTFADASERVHLERISDWRNRKHRDQWISTLRTYAFPSIGSRPIDKVTAGDVRDLLAPIWQTKPETARRVLQRIGTVLNWAHSKGHRSAEAPLNAIRSGLNRQNRQPKHHSALGLADVAPLITKLRRSHTAGRLALRFAILTAARSGEVRGATWEEIDLQRALWTVPAARMKAKKEHVVPLSSSAIEILSAAAKLRKGVAGEPIFPGMREKPLSDMTLTKTLRTAIGGDWTVHGFRSTFRIWAAQCTSFPSEAAEAALAHTIPSKVVRSYLRTDYLDKRREMMEQWADHIDPRPRLSPTN